MGLHRLSSSFSFPFRLIRRALLPRRSGLYNPRSIMPQHTQIHTSANVCLQCVYDRQASRRTQCDWCVPVIIPLTPTNEPFAPLQPPVDTHHPISSIARMPVADRGQPSPIQVHMNACLVLSAAPRTGAGPPRTWQTPGGGRTSSPSSTPWSTGAGGRTSCPVYVRVGVDAGVNVSSEVG